MCIWWFCGPCKARGFASYITCVDGCKQGISQSIPRDFNHWGSFRTIMWGPFSGLGPIHFNRNACIVSQHHVCLRTHH